MSTTIIHIIGIVLTIIYIALLVGTAVVLYYEQGLSKFEAVYRSTIFWFVTLLRIFRLEFVLAQEDIDVHTEVAEFFRTLNSSDSASDGPEQIFEDSPLIRYYTQVRSAAAAA